MSMDAISGAAAQNTSKRWIPSLDGLRGIAVLLVLLAHLQGLHRIYDIVLEHVSRTLAPVFLVDPGDLGVSIFFTISGFLITTLLLKEQKRGSISLKRFYVRRFFRIFPPYYVYLLAVFVLWWMQVVPLRWNAFLPAVFYISNYYPYWLSHPESFGHLTGHTWSLSLEEQFYIIWPLCLCLLSRRKATVTGMVLFLLTPVSRMLTLSLFPRFAFDEQISRMFHTRIDAIMIGCVLALLPAWPAAQRTLDRVIASAWSMPTSLGLLLFDLVLGANNKLYRRSVGLTLESLLLAFLLAWLVARPNTRLGGWMNHAALRHVGVISYSLYLWQQLFTGPVNLFGTHRSVPVVLLACFAAAELSYWLVELPSHRVRDTFLKRFPKTA